MQQEQEVRMRMRVNRVCVGQGVWGVQCGRRRVSTQQSVSASVALVAALGVSAFGVTRPAPWQVTGYKGRQPLCVFAGHCHLSCV